MSKAEGGTDEHTNLQSICKPCHDAKTAAEGARGRGRR
ncbi:HNH endonuclease (plasmid) [Burkholderia ambifaria]